MTPLDFTPETVLCVGAHPDDIDCHAGGTVALWTATGVKVHYLVLTSGELGSHNPAVTPKTLAKVRRAEQHAVAEVLGLASIRFANFYDGRLTNNPALRREIVRAIRELQPDTVLGWDPGFTYSSAHGVINHSDHRAAGLATLDAVNTLADTPGHFPGLTGRLGQTLAPHAVQRLLMMTLTGQPDYAVDMSEVVGQKIKAMQRHTSQVSPAHEAMVLGWGTAIGAAAGYQYGESFNGFTVRP